MTKKLNFKKYFFYIFLYLFIYSPPFSVLPVNISLLMSIFCFLLLYDGKLAAYLNFFKGELFLLFLICCYALVLAVYSGTIAFYDPFILLFFNIPTVFLIYYIMKRIFGHSSDIYSELINSLMIVATIASCISIFLWFNKDLNEVIKFEVLKYSEELLVYQSHRGFGLADEFLFSYSIVQACIFLLVIERRGFNFKTMIFALLIFLSVSLNARIGFLFLSLFVFIPSIRKKSSIKWIIVFFITLFTFFSIYQGNEFILFVLDQFEYFIDDATSRGSDAGIVDALVNEMLFIPENSWQLFFGNGENVFQLQNSKNSDIGFIILWFYGGLLYLTLILTFFSYCYGRGLKIKMFAPITILIVMVLVANFKGLFFAAKPGMHLFLCVYIIMMLSSNRFSLRNTRRLN